MKKFSYPRFFALQEQWLLPFRAIGPIFQGKVFNFGIEVFDLGVDVAPEKFISSLKAHNANMLALSALLTTMPLMKKTIDALVESGLGNRIQFIIGGAPVNQKFADSIGADGYAPDAGAAARIAKTLLSE